MNPNSQPTETGLMQFALGAGERSSEIPNWRPWWDRKMFIMATFLMSGCLCAKPVLATECPIPRLLVAGTYSAQRQPVAVAAGDLNGDGRADLVLANQFSASISVLLGQGDGTFSPAVNYAAGSGPSSIGLQDFDRDGRLDV